MTSPESLDPGIDLQATRRRLEAMRLSAIARKEALAQPLHHREVPLPADLEDQAVELENDEAMVAIEAELDLELRKVDAALQRIKAGSYERCESCAETIGRARLEALPEASLCVNCATAAEATA